MGEFDQDLDAIKRHYTESFLPSNPWAALINTLPYLYQRQRHRRLREVLVTCGFGTQERLREMTALDVGCGAGGNLAWLADLGANPAHLTGVDLLEQRVEVARSRFAGIRFLSGGFLETDVGGPFDVVMLLAVLTSVPNQELKRRIVERALALIKPGGVFFFYDMVSRRRPPARPGYQGLTYDELDAYVAPHKLHYFRRDLIDSRMATRLLPRLGVTFTELVQATGLFNVDGAFAYLRA